MSLDLALRLTEIMLGFAFIQQSLEHIYSARGEHLLFIPRLILSALLVAGLWTPFAFIGLFINAQFILRRFQGPYNGGSDRMGLLILCCLTAAQLMPLLHFQVRLQE